MKLPCLDKKIHQLDLSTHNGNLDSSNIICPFNKNNFLRNLPTNIWILSTECHLECVDDSLGQRSWRSASPYPSSASGSWQDTGCSWMVGFFLSISNWCLLPLKWWLQQNDLHSLWFPRNSIPNLRFRPLSISQILINCTHLRGLVCSAKRLS